MENKPQHIEQWLEALGNPSADRDYKPGHARLLQLLGHIHTHRPSYRIRVAGTNGKGSTAFMLAAALQACGLKVGLYSSPHIHCFNERIRINSLPLSTALLWRSLEQIMPVALDVGASYFETATALALDQFSRHRVDIEILEAGVGARLDTCTAVPADMALITPIGLDHQDWLGDSLAEIALEKAHVMSGCSYSITAPQCQEVEQVLRQFNARLNTIGPLRQWTQLAAAGVHQQCNASLAYAAMIQLKSTLPGIDLARATQAINQCQVPGRLQHIRISQAHIWLDAAHNRHAIAALLPSLPDLAAPLDAILVFTRQDRSLRDSLPLLKPYCKQLISNDDSADSRATVSAVTALQQQLQQHPAGRFLVLGSFTTVAAILAAFEADT